MERNKNEDRLWKIANEQQGFFTAKQAKESGYKDSNFKSYLRSRVWQKIQRGIYRLARFPETERPELMIWSLWSANLHEIGVWTHETALEIYDLSDVNPTKLHMTVPLNFRKKGIPNSMTLHFGSLSKVEIQNKDGYYITTPIRTLVDVFREGAIEESLLHQSVKEAISKGLVTKVELTRVKRIYPEIRRIMEVIDD